MRNDLVHQGVLSGTNFPGKTVTDCGLITAETLDWIDLYVFSVLKIGKPGRSRFKEETFKNINSFSL